MDNVGLRERKRLETQRDIEEAAIELVARDGLERTTVDAISQRANVSARTFFNYFDSKEAAILGLHDYEITHEMLSTYVAVRQSTDVITTVVGMLLDILGPSIADPALHKARKQAIHQYPHLLERQFTHMTRMTNQLTDATRTLLQEAPHFDKQSPSNLRLQSEVVLMICGGGVRVAIREWVMTSKKISLDTLKQRAVSLTREVIEKL